MPRADRRRSNQESQRASSPDGNGTPAGGAVPNTVPSVAGEAKFQGLLESAPDAIVIVDREGKINIVNTQVERLFGYDRDEMIGRPVEMLIPERLRRLHNRHRGGYLSEPHTRPMGIGLDLVAQRKDRSLFSVEISLSPLQTAMSCSSPPSSATSPTVSVRPRSSSARSSGGLRTSTPCASSARS